MYDDFVEGPDGPGVVATWDNVLEGLDPDCAPAWEVSFSNNDGATWDYTSLYYPPDHSAAYVDAATLGCHTWKVRVRSACLDRATNTPRVSEWAASNSITVPCPAVSLENGNHFLLQNGGNLELE